MSLSLSGNGVVTGLDSAASSDLGAALASKLPIAGGKVLQIVRATDTTQRSTTSTSFTDVTGMSVTITPSKNDSALLLLAVGLFDIDGASSRGELQITDNSNNSISGAETSSFGSGSGFLEVTQVLIAYATPATTSAVTYKLRFRTLNAGFTIRNRNNLQTGQMYAIEVSA